MEGIATGGPFGSGLPFLSLADLPTTQGSFLCSVVEVSIVTFSSKSFDELGDH